MFELMNWSAHLSSFNPRTEKHGADSDPASDLKFSVNVESAYLHDFHPDLRSMLYCKTGQNDDLADAAHDLPNLRFPKFGPLKWATEYAGYSLTVHLGLDSDSGFEIADCKVNNFVISPQEGGTVIVTFRVQCHPDERAAGKLSMLVQNSVDITLSAPETATESGVKTE